jgi:hypothetical protein
MRGSVRGPELAGERRTSGQTRGLQGLHARAFRPGSARAQAIGARLAGRIEGQALIHALLGAFRGDRRGFGGHSDQQRGLVTRMASAGSVGCRFSDVGSHRVPRAKREHYWTELELPI